MPDNELDVRQSQGERSGADGHVDSSGTGVATAAHDGEELEPNKDGRNWHQAVGYRAELRLAENIVNPESWAGGLDDKRAIAPRLRVGRDKWFNLLWLIPIGFALLVAAVAMGKGLHNMPAVQAFIQRYPGTHAPSGVSPGIPAWVGWTHFFNLFLMMFIIRSGIQILCDHPRLYFSRNATPGKDEWLRVAKPVPDDPLWTAKDDSVALPGQLGLPGIRHSIGLARWWHLGVDVLWLLNGTVFYVLLFTTGQWRHLVPTSWDVFPNAVSVAIQYLSGNWPTDNTWVAYNGLQLLAYFTTVFIAAPLALITGLGMSPALSMRLTVISKRLSIQARTLAALPGAGVFHPLHRCPRHAGLRHRGVAQPQPHVRRPRRQQLGRVLGLRRGHGGGGRRLGGRHPVHPSPPAGGPAGRLRAHRAAAAAVRVHQPEAGRVHRKGHLAVLLAQRHLPGDR